MTDTAPIKTVYWPEYRSKTTASPDYGQWARYYEGHPTPEAAQAVIDRLQTRLDENYVYEWRIAKVTETTDYIPVP